MAVVILHVHKYEEKVTRRFKSGGLHEERVVAMKDWRKLHGEGILTLQ